MHVVALVGQSLDQLDLQHFSVVHTSTIKHGSSLLQTVVCHQDKSGLLISSGQLGITKEGQIPEKFIDQTKLCFANILSILKEANFSLDDILKVSAFVTDRKYFKDYMIIRDQFLKNVLIKPTSTLLIVSGFTKPEFLVEIEIIAQKIHS